MEFTNEPKIQEMRPMTLDYVRKELQKIGNPQEELVYYIWHLSNKREQEAQDYLRPLISENKMRLEQLQYQPNEKV